MLGTFTETFAKNEASARAAIEDAKTVEQCDSLVKSLCSGNTTLNSTIDRVSIGWDEKNAASTICAEYKEHLDTFKQGQSKLLQELLILCDLKKRKLCGLPDPSPQGSHVRPKKVKTKKSQRQYSSWAPEERKSMSSQSCPVAREGTRKTRYTV